VFPHDNGTFSTLIARSSADRALAALRHTDLFEAATRAIPVLATWTDPLRAQPHTPVLPGGHLHNTYQGQLDDPGRVALLGLVFVGDAVCTTNPALGRGVTTSLLQARELLRLLEGQPAAARRDTGATYRRPHRERARRPRLSPACTVEARRGRPRDLAAGYRAADRAAPSAPRGRHRLSDRDHERRTSALRSPHRATPSAAQHRPSPPTPHRRPNRPRIRAVSANRTGRWVSKISRVNPSPREPLTSFLTSASTPSAA